MHHRRPLGIARTLAWLTACLAAAPAAADTAAFTAPDFDRWNYPFNGTPGIRTTAPTFGAFESDGSFDNRDGQFLIGFNTAAALPSPAPGLVYRVNSVTVTATHSSGSFTYDPTYDTIDTYDGGPTADADAGRPIVLTGAATRATAGFVGFSFGPSVSGPPFYEEAEAYAFGDPTAAGVRNAYAAAFNDAGVLVDVSNNVREGFELNPFAVGTTGLTAGDAVVEAVPGTSPGSTFTFDIDVSDPDTLGYIEDGIAGGGLFFTVSSLHTTTQSGGANPNFYTRDNFDPAAVAPTLTIDYSVVAVPEPAAAVVLGIGALAVAGRRRRPRH